jgi:hypothetical protein
MTPKQHNWVIITAREVQENGHKMSMVNQYGNSNSVNCSSRLINS